MDAESAIPRRSPGHDARGSYEIRTGAPRNTAPSTRSSRTTMKTALRFAALAAFVLAGACSDSPTGGNQTVREIGIIRYQDFDVDITVPATARAGQAFTVRVITRAGGCSNADDTEVIVIGSNAVVTPYDIRTTGSNLTCGDQLQVFTHTASVGFSVPGPATVTVVGRREPGGDEVRIVRAVDVQPAA